MRPLHFLAPCVLALVSCEKASSPPPIANVASPSSQKPVETLPVVATLDEIQTLLAIHFTIATSIDAGEKPDLGKIVLLGQSLRSAAAIHLKQRLFDFAGSVEKLPIVYQDWREKDQIARRARDKATSLRNSVEFAASRLGRGGDAARNDYLELTQSRIPNANEEAERTSKQLDQARVRLTAELNNLKATSEALKVEIESHRTTAGKI